MTAVVSETAGADFAAAFAAGFADPALGATLGAATCGAAVAATSPPVNSVTSGRNPSALTVTFSGPVLPAFCRMQGPRICLEGGSP